MPLAFFVAAALTSWIPARWHSADPQTLRLLRHTPINCLLLERQHWSEPFLQAAAAENLAVLGVIRPGPDALAAALAAARLPLAGAVLEGDFDAALRRRLRDSLAGAGRAVIELAPRASMNFDDPVIGTYQGLWPGIHTLDDGTAKAAPTGAPWIDTNTGFLRFVRALTRATVWIANLPPANEVVTPARYLQAVSDAAMVGARWVVALDPDFNRRLFAAEPKALDAWKRIGEVLAFWEQHRDKTLLPPAGRLAVIQDLAAGGLLSNGVLDMIAARHTPLRAVPVPKLDPGALAGARMALNVDPAALSAHQKQTLRDFTRAGGTLLTAPPGWTFSPPAANQITVGEKEVEKLDDIWRGVNSIVGRENLGVRLFNVAGMRSELVAAPSGRPTVLHLVNYADYPVENVTAHLLGRFTRARLYLPAAPPAGLEVYESGEIDIPRVTSCAILVLE